jgi:hypothetical protein
MIEVSMTQHLFGILKTKTNDQQKSFFFYNFRCHDIQYSDIQHNAAQHNLMLGVTLSTLTFSIKLLNWCYT